MGYLFCKALHIVGFVSWFAGLFYLVRLFIYHLESAARPEPERAVLHAQFSLMESRLWKVITVPAMVLTLVFGGGLAGQYVAALPELSAASWLGAKLLLVIGLVAYTFICGRLRRQLAEGRCTWTSGRLRMWNEVATLLLVAIVMLAVFKTLFNALWGTLGLIVFGIVLGMAVRIVRRRAVSRAAS